MINIQGDIPHGSIHIACSGGVDSMAIVDFLRRDRKVHMVFVNHQTEASRSAYFFLREYVENVENVDLLTFNIDATVPKDVSLEEHWRNERYKVFHSVESPVITCHHLDDCVETWVWSCMHGEGKIIPYSNKNVIRPFRTNTKVELIDWAVRHDVPWEEDQSNNDMKHMRNYIRYKVMPHILHINPGIAKVIKKKVLS